MEIESIQRDEKALEKWKIAEKFRRYEVKKQTKIIEKKREDGIEISNEEAAATIAEIPALKPRPMDPLPMPDGLPPPALVAAKGDPLSEVTAIAAHPLYPVGVSTDGVDRRPPSGIVPERTVPRITSPDAEERTQTAEVTAQNRALGQSGSTARTETLTNRRALQALVVLFAVLFVAALLWGLGR